jgi:hypothetical protein
LDAENREKLKVFVLDTLEQPPHQSFIAALNPEQSFTLSQLSFKEPIFDGKIPSFDGQTTTNSQ